MIKRIVRNCFCVREDGDCDKCLSSVLPSGEIGIMDSWSFIEQKDEA